MSRYSYASRRSARLLVLRRAAGAVDRLGIEGGAGGHQTAGDERLQPVRYGGHPNPGRRTDWRQYRRVACRNLPRGSGAVGVERVKGPTADGLVQQLAAVVETWAGYGSEADAAASAFA